MMYDSKAVNPSENECKIAPPNTPSIPAMVNELVCIERDIAGCLNEMSNIIFGEPSIKFDATPENLLSALNIAIDQGREIRGAIERLRQVICG